MTKKIANEKNVNDTKEKGLILASIGIKKPIAIQFMNKKALKLFSYDKHQITTLKIE